MQQETDESIDVSSAISHLSNLGMADCDTIAAHFFAEIFVFILLFSHWRIFRYLYRRPIRSALIIGPIFHGAFKLL